MQKSRSGKFLSDDTTVIFAVRHRACRRIGWLSQRGSESHARAIRVDARGAAIQNLVGMRLEGMPEFIQSSEWSTAGDESASFLRPSGHQGMGNTIDSRENPLGNRGRPASPPG